MSYIRSDSNPEALYIYNTEDGLTDICWNITEPQKVTVPTEDFTSILDAYMSDSLNINEGFTSGNIRLIKLGSHVIFYFDNYLDLELKLWKTTFDYVINIRRKELFQHSFKRRFRFLFDWLVWYGYK